MSSLKGFVSGLLIGGVAGTVTMLLMAPKSGKRTRAKMRRQYDEFRDHMAESMEDAEDEMLSKAHHLASDARHTAKEVRHRGQEMVAHR